MATRKRTNAVDLLKADHRKVEKLFQRYEKSRSAGVKSKLAEQICLELSVHMAIEEQIFYPGVKDAIKRETHDEAHVEHDGAKHLIAEVSTGSPDAPFYDAKVKVLSEMIKHHVKEEEQRGGMFAQAKAGGVDLAALGSVMAARKAQLTKQFKRDGIPTPVMRTMSDTKPARSAAPVPALEEEDQREAVA